MRFRVQRFKGSEVQRFKGSEVQRFRGTGFKGSEVQGSKVQRYRVHRLGVQSYRFTVQGCSLAGASFQTHSRDLT